MVLHQVKYLINGNILPLSIQRQRISEKLLIESVMGDGYTDSSIGLMGHVVAYVGVESKENVNYFDTAEDYLNLFLYLYTLQTGQPWIKFTNVGFEIESYSDLGKISPGFPGFSQIIHEGESLERHKQSITSLCELFHYIESDYVTIINSPLGLALQFFYDAIMSNHRRRIELAVVHFMIAAESLVVLGEESKRQNVSKRIGALIAESDGEYEEIYKKMKKMYDIRSGIVHGGSKVASPKDVQTLYIYLRKATLERLSLKQISKKELVKKLDEISVDWKIKNELQSMRTFQN